MPASYKRLSARIAALFSDRCYPHHFLKLGSMVLGSCYQNMFVFVTYRLEPVFSRAGYRYLTNIRSFLSSLVSFEHLLSHVIVCPTVYSCSPHIFNLAESVLSRRASGINYEINRGTVVRIQFLVLVDPPSPSGIKGQDSFDPSPIGPSNHEAKLMKLFMSGRITRTRGSTP